MKKLLLILLTFISLNTFAQMQVKEGSFKHIPNAIMNDKYDHLDGNDLPMALIKISTENIPEQERLRLKFSGNLATQITQTPKTGQMWIYISAENATFINIMHPDYGTCKYHLPEKLCDFCTYEMVLQYVPINNIEKSNYLIIKSDQSEANIYIDDTLVGKQFVHKQMIVGTTHTWKIECDLFRAESGSCTITNDENIIEVTMIPKEDSVFYCYHGESNFVDSDSIGFGYLDVIMSPENGIQEENGHEYVDLGLSVKWATCNVGANNPEEYGDYFAWGETCTKLLYTKDNCRTYGKTMSDISGNVNYDAARTNWGGKWRMPTKTEFDELESECTWMLVTRNGINGCEIIGPNGNSIFLPEAGYHLGNMNRRQEEGGFYWSSTPYDMDKDKAYYLDFSTINMSKYGRFLGRTIRPVIE